MNFLIRLWQLSQNYFFARMGFGYSTASFWYLKSSPNIFDKTSLTKYKNSKGLYVFDYRSKLKYSYTNKEGIIILPYKGQIGDQLNPEAAFQYALGVYDEYLATQKEDLATKFLQYADYFLNLQTKEGDWQYQFSWYANKAPWTSALAQGRGASVMLRAWFLTNKEVYLKAAKLAVTKFALPLNSGGYLAYSSLANCYYYEEYPLQQTGVINGFMAALFGLWELSYWAHDNECQRLWEQGIAALKKLLPFYTTKHWTLYDQLPFGKIKNYNSVFYHKMIIDYVLILGTIGEDESLINYYQKWKKQDILANRIFFSMLKIIRKLFYR